MDYDKKTYVDAVASHGLLCFGVSCDLQTWLDSPERVMRHVRDGMTAREINRSRWGAAVDVRVDVEDLKACARRGLLRCEKGRWFTQHNARAMPSGDGVADESKLKSL
jgi:hypothetical protein